MAIKDAYPTIKGHNQLAFSTSVGREVTFTGTSFTNGDLLFAYVTSEVALSISGSSGSGWTHVFEQVPLHLNGGSNIIYKTANGDDELYISCGQGSFISTVVSGYHRVDYGKYHNIATQQPSSPYIITDKVRKYLWLIGQGSNLNRNVSATAPSGYSGTQLVNNRGLYSTIISFKEADSIDNAAVNWPLPAVPDTGWSTFVIAIHPTPTKITIGANNSLIASIQGINDDLIIKN